MTRIFATLSTLAALLALPAGASAHLDPASVLGGLTDATHTLGGSGTANDPGPDDTGTPTPGGFASKDVGYVGFVPFETGTATGSRIVGTTMYLTSWRSFSIYDVSKPESPVLKSITPVGFRFENEDVAATDKLMFFSSQLPQSVLYIYDVTDKTKPVQVAALSSAGDHTTECIDDCTYTYGSSGTIVRVGNGANAEIMKDAAGKKLDWRKMIGLTGGVHDVSEYTPGFILVSTYKEPFQIVDVRDPLAPKVVATGEHPDPSGYIFHSGHWPRGGKDKLVLMQGEQNFQPQCHEKTGPFMTFDASDVKKTGQMTLLDTFRLPNGTYTNGKPAANALGCSAHWFQEHPSFKDGGLVALGYYEHGTRFVDVAKNGAITEKGWFLPYAGSTSAAYWATDRIVYAIDYTRGFDILRWNGDLDKGGAAGARSKVAKSRRAGAARRGSHRR